MSGYKNLAPFIALFLCDFYLQAINNTSAMGELDRELLSLYLQKTGDELEIIQIVVTYEDVRKKWLQAELELKRHKDLLVKADVARASLEVKLKHARNQVDVEIKKRYKAEADYQYLERQMQLICEILVNDSKSSACLNDEQRSVLANINHRGAQLPLQKTKRLSVIDESSFLFHSDVSYDRSDDDLDLDTTVIKPHKSRAREKRRSSMGPSFGPPVQRRGRGSGRSGDLLGGRMTEREIETTVTASVTTPENGAQIHMVIDITQDKAEASKTLQHFPQATEQTSVWAATDETSAESEIAEVGCDVKDVNMQQGFTPTAGKVVQHVFLSKTVIRPEVCVACGKRIRFGKVALKCRDCRVVAHSECKHLCPEACSLTVPGPIQKSPEDVLESFAPSTHPRIPQLIVQCVNEIEKRGLEERGIYRVPGGERLVKELREKYLLGKGPLALSKVDEIHAVCGLLKDFLRKLKEPLVTFKLHQTFIDACDIDDEDNSTAAIFQAVGDLPQANRDTLAFLMLHLQKVMRSPRCQMGLNNLSRVFGPTIVGHGTMEPSPRTIMKDTNAQSKVVARLLSLSTDYWKQLVVVERDQVISSVIDANLNSDTNNTDRDRLFRPLTSPELSKCHKIPGSGALRGKFKNLGTAFNNTNKSKMDISKRKFFTSPS
ncbi:rac GTPase-activating protein 1 isoform X1 [Paramormyrops kingsleyae]|uniref:rac GTPase-activating protein 1 isoform X1 n=2 Tax=Paramormyrops kingsleyae TaxID=1676925 RepID=UPI003B975CA0